MSRPKRYPLTEEQERRVFNLPLSFPSNATLPRVPRERLVPLFPFSIDRGGKAQLLEITLSHPGDDDKRLIGIRTVEEGADIAKEDHIEVNRRGKVWRWFPKGRYEGENPLYRGTHYRPSRRRV